MKLFSENGLDKVSLRSLTAAVSINTGPIAHGNDAMAWQGLLPLGRLRRRAWRGSDRGGLVPLKVAQCPARRLGSQWYRARVPSRRRSQGMACRSRCLRSGGRPNQAPRRTPQTGGDISVRRDWAQPSRRPWPVATPAGGRGGISSGRPLPDRVLSSTVWTCTWPWAAVLRPPCDRAANI